MSDQSRLQGSIDYDYTLTPRGAVAVKGKGNMETFLLATKP